MCVHATHKKITRVIKVAGNGFLLNILICIGTLLGDYRKCAKTDISNWIMKGRAYHINEIKHIIGSANKYLQVCSFMNYRWISRGRGFEAIKALLISDLKESDCQQCGTHCFITFIFYTCKYRNDFGSRCDCKELLITLLNGKRMK